MHAPDDQLDWAAMMYFSFTVLTSTGFGEITPVTRMARALIVIEQVLGVMYVAFLMARLANLYGTRGIAGTDGHSASRFGRAEGFLLQQPAAMRMQARHLGRRIDLEPAGQALGDEGGHVGLGEAAQQQIASASTIASTAANAVFICAMQSSIQG